ncbi:MAG: helix-turn-helix transcriptional regulator [Verrucomicrobiaceae bacterium]|nr:helix-turn-helix transcriptional regulator [Verrucomicrobiaceae bacterium]
MSDAATAPTPAISPPVPPTRQVGPAQEVLRAIIEPACYAALRELADGKYATVVALARKAGCHPDQMGRHLRRMRKAGLVMRVNPGERADQRSKYYQVPPEFRSTLPDGTRVLDFRSVVLRFEVV